ncbi:MAG: S46 family peptidase [Crocinitomicaceae bacterium]|nr:S46 family peptidase [Crocinitomicaceae bacterium]
MKKIGILITLILSTFFRLNAEEGMLIPSLIKAFESDMQAMGMKLTADQIYSVNNSSLKDAILHFGGGCTAELVSSEGLLLTNHHCGYSQVQSHSSLENDYIKYGFWAKNKEQELKNPGLTAARIVRIDDVTISVLNGTEGLTGEAFEKRLKENMKVLENDAVTGNHYKAEIKAFNYGNDYYMVVKEVFTDIRLVGAPPSSVGKFGGDTDNWVWPRHTGDFSVFRIYAGKDNKPADFSADNKPYSPLHFFPVSVRNRVPGEFTMVYGFPGSTEQHLSSGHLEYIQNKERPARISMRDKSLAAINASMASSDLLRIKYASKQARIANGWKKWIGQIGGLQSVDAIQIKLDREKAFNDKAATKSEWKEKYGQLVEQMNALVAERKDDDFAYAMDVEYIFIGAEMFKRCRSINKLIGEYETLKELGELSDEIEKYKKGSKSFFKDYDNPTDRKMFTALTDEYKKQVVDFSFSKYLSTRTSEELAKDIYEGSVLTDETKFNEFLDNLDENSIEEFKKNDQAYLLWKELFDHFVTVVIPKSRDFDAQMNGMLKIYVAGKMEMFPDGKHWPDANSTMRISYGKMEGSAPHDGMQYLEHTTLDGLIAKNQTGKSDFDLLPRMKELAAKKDYGGYDQDGDLWVCFTSSNHTTGGNSGSPVIDAEGYLMGLNFDRSWESTMSDYMFDPNRCRNITVDIRYVLWIMDKYADAGHLVKEMTLIKGDSPYEANSGSCSEKEKKCKRKKRRCKQKCKK